MSKNSGALPRPEAQAGSIEFTLTMPSSAIANLLVLRFAERLIEGITRAAPAEDRITFATGRQDFAKTSYVDIDGSIRDVSGSFPGALQKLLP